MAITASGADSNRAVHSATNNVDYDVVLSGYTVPAGSDRILVVGMQGEQVDECVSCTFAGSAMTQIGNDVTNSISLAGMFYYLAPSGTGDVVATMKARATTTIGISVTALTLVGAAQQAPTALGEDTASSSPLTVSDTIAAAGAILNTMVGNYAGSDPAITEGPDQVEDVAVGTNDDGGWQYGMSHRIESGAGTYDHGWSFTTRIGMVSAFFEEAAAAGGAVQKQIKRANLGADLYNGTIICRKRLIRRRPGLWVPPHVAAAAMNARDPRVWARR